MTEAERRAVEALLHELKRRDMRLHSASAHDILDALKVAGFELRKDKP